MTVNKPATQKFVKGRFNPKKLNDVEFKEQYQV
jgi:hypothetical protein